MAQPPKALVNRYRSAVRDVNTLSHQELLRYWRQFDLEDAVAVRDGLLDVLPDIVGTYHLTAATSAADFYDLGRDALGVKGRFSAVMAEEPNRSASQSLAHWGVGPLFSDEPSSALALSKISGGLQRLVVAGARDTITTSAHRDSGRIGWVRVGEGECDWCEQYLDGEVHYVEGYDFPAHDRCRCDAVIAT